MTVLSASDPLVDDIAVLIDEALADPTRAGLVKSAIRSRLTRVPPVAEISDDPADSEADDLWDNVPL